MRPRMVDVLLMAGLFLVGAAILWTLFTLGNDRPRPTPMDDAPPASSAPAPDAAGDVQALPPGEGDESAAGVTSPAADVPSDAPGAEASGDDAAPATDEPAADVVAAPPVIEGEPVPLQRVGFSFTTGGAGACGIVLEPWEHVAVSRDLLAVYGCGTEITIELADETAGRTRVDLIVADTMNEQFTRTANIYVAPDEPALAYGVTEGRLVP